MKEAPKRATADSTVDRLQSVNRIGYCTFAVINILVIGFAGVSSGSDLSLPYVLISAPVAVLTISRSFQVSRVLITPLTLFGTVWMVAVPLTSSAAPLMRPMTPEEIQMVALFGVAFSIGGLITSGKGRRDPAPATDPDVQKRINRRMTSFANWVLAVSILALLANTVLEGRLALLDVTSEQRKAVAQFPGFPLLSSLGTISLAIFARAGTLSKWRLLCSFVYLALQLLTGQRFVAVVGLVIVLITMTVARPMTRKSLRQTVWVGVAVIAAFAFVALFRGGQGDQQRFFISTGLYTGDPRLLQFTEIIRYVGMSQRNMSIVFERSSGAIDPISFTISPLTAVFIDPPAGLETSTFGYTANNILSYLYSDFGVFWIPAVVLLSVVVNGAFQRAWRRPTFTSSFTWGVSALAVSTSFFAYVNAYVYWVVLFPVIVALAEHLARVEKHRRAIGTFSGSSRNRSASRG